MTAPKRRTYYCSVCICDAVEKNTIHVALRNRKMLQYVYNVRERDKNKKEKGSEMLFSGANLFDTHTMVFCTRMRNTQIILFVFYSWPAGHPHLPSYCCAHSLTPFSLSLTHTLAFSSFFHLPSYQPRVWYLAKLMHSWAITYLHKIYSAALGVWVKRQH